MSQSLPVGQFEFVDYEEYSKIDWRKVTDDAPTGYVLEVDLEYPDELHDDHSDLPLAPEKITVTVDDMSSFQQNMISLDNSLKPRGNLRKLIPNLRPKRHYVVHYRNLKYYLAKGMILSRIHKVVSFRQEKWMEPYISFNTEMRKAAKSTSEKDFFKLLNNSLYGRCMMNLRKQINIQLATCGRQAQNLVARPTFQSFNIINDDVVAIRLNKATIYWDKPTYIGMCILDLSKLHVYKFHYETIREMYGSAATLLFTDTDSLCYHVRTKDLYADMRQFLHLMDTSNFPREHPLYTKDREKVVGTFKDECGAVQPVQFIGLRAKMYSLLLPPSLNSTDKPVDDGGNVKMTAKGVKRSYVQENVRHEHFLKVLETGVKTQAEFHLIRSKNHVLTTHHVIKDALNSFDDKRYIMDDGVSTLAFGHYKIAQRKLGTECSS